MPGGFFYHGAARAARESLVLHSIRGAFAIRRGDWKLIEDRGSGGWTAADGAAAAQLHDLRHDPGESENRIASEADIARELHALLARVREEGGTGGGR